MSAKQFETALLKARATFAQSIGAPSIPTVLWEDVGGLGLVKDEILDTVQLPLDHPELFQDGLKKRSGYLSLLFIVLLLTKSYYRCSAIWPPRNWKNTTCKSSGNFLLIKLFLSQGARITQHVHW